MSRVEIGDWRLEIADSRLQKGVAALQEGRRGEARRLLARAVCADSENAMAWLWLSRCVDEESRQRECLERALRLDPLNAAVRRALGQEAGARLRRIVGTGAATQTRLVSIRRFAPTRPALDSFPSRHSERRLSSAPKPQESERRLSSETYRNQASGSAQPATRTRFNAWRRHRLLLTALAVAVVALACALAPRIGWPASQAQPVGGETLEASGVIRAQEVLIASEWGGHIAAILVDEGEAVAAGDLLVQLDTALLDAQIKAARAVIAVAEAGLAQAEAGARPGQIKAAEAQLAQVQAARAAATQAVSDTLALVENPQDIRLQIAVTQAQAEAAQHHVARAVALKDAAEIGKDKFEKVRGKAGDRKVLVRSGPVSELPAILPPEIVGLLPTLGDGVYTFGDLVLHLHGGTYDLYKWINVHVPFELHLMPNNWWQAWVGVNAAVAQQEGIQASLAHLYVQRAHPQSLEALADEALAALAQSGAQVAAAQAQVSALKAGATREQIAALKARVAQAQAALDSLLAQRAMIEIVAPTDGIVVDVMAHSGEVASAGASLLTIADLSQVTLVVYVPENQIGRVRLDQRVQVTVDSFSDRVFAGQVAYISGRAEFTPRNVATKEERVNLVFAVEVHISNDDSALKPGMPADATFGG